MSGTQPKRASARPRSKSASRTARTRPGSATPRPSREGLLRKAIALFAQLGFDGVSTADIAAAAGYSQAIIHYHFGSKDNLWKEAVTQLIHDLDARFPIDRDELRDLKGTDKLRVLIRRFLLLSQYSPELTSILVRETLADSDRLKWLVSRHFGKRVNFLNGLISELIEAGEGKGLAPHIVTQNILLSGSMLFCMAPLIREIHGVDIDSREAAASARDDMVQLLLTGFLVR